MTSTARRFVSLRDSRSRMTFDVVARRQLQSETRQTSAQQHRGLRAVLVGRIHKPPARQGFAGSQLLRPVLFRIAVRKHSGHPEAKPTACRSDRLCLPLRWHGHSGHQEAQPGASRCDRFCVALQCVSILGTQRQRRPPAAATGFAYHCGGLDILGTKRHSREPAAATGFVSHSSA